MNDKTKRREHLVDQVLPPHHPAMRKGPFTRTPYNYDMKQASDETGLRCEDESLTHQAFKEETDINTIMRRFGVTGMLPQGSRIPTYGDFTGLTDYRTALDAVMDAEKAFMTLPGAVRARFGNDPQQLLDFLADKGNREEAIRLGLIEKPEEKPKPTEKPIEKGEKKENGGQGTT